MKTFGKFTKIAVAAAVTGALVLPASAAFAGDRNNKTERAILGAVIGGIAGAALSDGDRGGIAIGAVAGAALGASTGHGDRYDRDHRYSSGYRDSRYGSTATARATTAAMAGRATTTVTAARATTAATIAATATTPATAMTAGTAAANMETAITVSAANDGQA
jgi:hypothetical protein